MLTVPVLLFLAGAVILVGVVAVAMGRGGEMAEFAGDYLPPAMDDMVTAADVASVRPPSALWGYNVQVTDEAFNRIAQVITERDVEIAVLRQQLADLRSATGSQPSPTAELRAAWETGAGSRPDRPASAGAPGPARPEPGTAGQVPAAGPSEPGAAGDSVGRAEQAAAGQPPVPGEPGGAGNLASAGQPVSADESVSAGAPDGRTPSWWAGPAEGATANRDE
jgi:hypothetical protein